jgi:outer membrane protein assembly factor BamA
MKVEEKPTGNIMVGAGFSQSDKLSLTGSISQENAFGSGNTVGIDINTSSRYRTISLSTTNPYFTDDGISRTYEVYLRTVVRRSTRPVTTRQDAGWQHQVRRAVLGTGSRVLRYRRGKHRCQHR